MQLPAWRVVKGADESGVCCSGRGGDAWALCAVIGRIIMVGNMRAKNGPGFMAAAYVAANLDRFWGLGVIILSELSFVFLGHRKCFFGPQTHCWMLGSSIFFMYSETRRKHFYLFIFFSIWDLTFGSWRRHVIFVLIMAVITPSAPPYQRPHIPW